MGGNVGATNIGSVDIHHASSEVSAAVYPRLMFRFGARAGSGESLLINGISAHLTVKGEDGSGQHIGSLIPEKPLYNVYSNTEISLTLSLDLDYYKLLKIEELRGSGDLKLAMNGVLILEKAEQPQHKGEGYMNNLEFKIPKSDWVEKMLPALGLKNVSLIEIPKIDPKFKEIAEHLDLAWQQHFHGKYNLALTECRKALEALSKEVKDSEFETKDNGKSMPDWKALFNSEGIGDILGTTVKKTVGFAAPSAHTGSSVNREHSDYAILVTQAIVHLVTTRLSELTE